MSCKIFYSYWLWFLFFNSGLSSYGRSLLAAEIDVPLSQGNPLRLNSGTRGWRERCELTTGGCGPWCLGEVRQVGRSPSQAPVIPRSRFLLSVPSPGLCPGLWLCTEVCQMMCPVPLKVLGQCRSYSEPVGHFSHLILLLLSKHFTVEDWLG